MTITKMIRRVGLVVLILAGLAFVVINWIAFAQWKIMIIPAVAFTGIYVWIIALEIIGAATGYKKTLSTRWHHWAEKHPALSWGALLMFWIAMTALVVHLGVYW